MTIMVDGVNYEDFARLPGEVEKFISDYNTNEDLKKRTFFHKLPGDNIITDLGSYSGTDTVSREDSNIIGPKLPEDCVDDKIEVLKFSNGKMVSKHNFYLYYTILGQKAGRRRRTNRKKSKRRKTKRRKSTRRR